MIKTEAYLKQTDIPNVSAQGYPLEVVFIKEDIKINLDYSSTIGAMLDGPSSENICIEGDSITQIQFDLKPGRTQN